MGQAIGLPLAMVASLAMIVVTSLGLTGTLGLHQVSTGTLVTSLFSGNLPALIVSIMGLCGATSITIVSGVSLGFACFIFMVSSVAAMCCCLKR
jgi:hypothetical protein